VVQFNEESRYKGSILEDVNRACKSFGAKLNVRFWGHYGAHFDCRYLRQLPEVRSLNLDCLAAVANIDELAGLQHLEEFAFGVFESDLPELLRTPSLINVRRLILAESRKNNTDLSPLADYQYLDELSLNAQARGIESIAHHDGLRRLFLSSMGNKLSLKFVQTMNGLVSLTLMLGGRVDLSDLAHHGIRHLEVLRVRGIAEIDLALFPGIEKLRVEDQIQLQALNVKRGPNLRWLSIWNCRTFSELQGVRDAENLRYLFIGKTGLEPDAILLNLPRSLKHLSITGYGKRQADELKSRTKAMGFDPAPYMEDPD
jgi:hypothetical protein